MCPEKILFLRDCNSYVFMFEMTFLTPRNISKPRHTSINVNQSDIFGIDLQ